MADYGQPPVTQITPEDQELASFGELQNLSTNQFFPRLGFLENYEFSPQNLAKFAQLGPFASTSQQDWESDLTNLPKLGPHWTAHYGGNLFADAENSHRDAFGFSMNPRVPIIADTPATDNELEAPPEEETEEDKKYSQMTLANLIPKMMFVSGETAEPSIETTTLIEDITRQQVIEIVREFSVSPVK